jgi:hypothetical protein
LGVLLAAGLIVSCSTRMEEQPAHQPSVQEIANQVLAEAQRTWRKDAYLTRIDLVINGDQPGQHSLGFTLYSPSKRIAEYVPRGQKYGNYVSPIKPGDYIDVGPIPDYKIDMGHAIAIARQHGLTGRLERAYLEVHHPRGKSPILAWVVQTDDPLDGNLRSKVPAIDPFTGNVMAFADVFNPPPGSDAELAAAARRFWMALHGRFGGRGGMPFEFGSVRIGPDGQPEAGSYYSADEHDRQVLLENTYWNGGPEAYDRALNGESTWSESCENAGC